MADAGCARREHLPSSGQQKLKSEFYG